MDDELLAAVRARVNRYVRSGDAEDVLDPAGVRDARALLAVARELPAGRTRRGGRGFLIDAQHAAGLLYYARHVALSASGDETDLDLSEPLLLPLLDQIAELFDQVQELAEVLKRPVRLNPQRFAVFAFAGSRLDEIDTIIAATRHAVRSAADDATDILPLRMNVARAQELRYGRTGDVADLTDAITTVREVLAATPATDPAYADRLTALAGLLQMRFVAIADTGDLDASIATYQQALAEALAGDEDRPMYLSNLGRARLTRYWYVSRDPGDLDAAFEMIQTAVATTPVGDPAQGIRLGGLHKAYRLRFEHTDDLTDLDAALRTAYQAVEATAPGHPGRAELLLDVGLTHMVRYGRTGHSHDAATAIDVARQVMRAAPKGHPLYAAARELLNRARRPRL